jgi:gluconolactonase
MSASYRELLGVLALGLAVMTAGCKGTDPGTPPPVAEGSASPPISEPREASARNDPGDEPRNPLAEPFEVTRVATDFRFTEGPVWIADEGVLLFSDIPADTIHRLDASGTVTVFRGPTDPPTNANGLALDPSGRLLACEHSTARITRLVEGSTPEVVVDGFESKTFNSPNDLVVRSDGTIYFTDPTFGGKGSVGFRGVYRVDPAGELHVIARHADTQPNGVALSPDETTLYVVDTTASLVRAFAVAPDGSTGEGAFLTKTGGGGDGLAVDVDGNLYVADQTGVLVLHPDGSRWGIIEIPEQPTNCTFGGADRRTLYVTARTSLYRVDLPIPGHPQPR